jgi:hypothetical protein
VHANDRLVRILRRIQAPLEQCQTQLILTLGMETAVTIGAGGKRRPLTQLANMNFQMNFEGDPENSPLVKGT